MRRTLLPVVIGTLLAGLAPVALAGQWRAGPPGEDHVSLALMYGRYAPTSDLGDGTSFGRGGGLGVAAAWWATRHLGLQGSVFQGTTEARAPDEGPTSASWFDPKVWAFGVGPAFRRPAEFERVHLSPWVTAGVGAKHYRWAVYPPRRSNTTLAWSLGGGVDIRPTAAPQYGLVAEVRGFRSKYPWHGFQPDPQPQNDLAVAVGLSVNL